MEYLSCAVAVSVSRQYSEKCTQKLLRNLFSPNLAVFITQWTHKIWDLDPD